MERSKTPIIPPRREDQATRQPQVGITSARRNDSRRAEWKRQVGDHRRSLAETAMDRIRYFSNGALPGSTLKNRNEDAQKTETRLRCKILNHFTQLGMPNFTFEYPRQRHSPCVFCAILCALCGPVLSGRSTGAAVIDIASLTGHINEPLCARSLSSLSQFLCVFPLFFLSICSEFAESLSKESNLPDGRAGIGGKTP